MAKHDSGSSTVIFRYMELEYFILLMETKKLRVNRRKTFNDILESNLDLKKQFYLQVVDDNISFKANDYLKDKAIDIKKKSNLHKYLSEFPVSCWTLNSTEDPLMWKSYTPRLGIRIKSTVGQFTESISAKDCRIYYDKISYQYDTPYKDAYDILFIKAPFYKNENEFRFYFCRDSDKETVPYLPNEKFSFMNYIELDVDVHKLVTEATLTPYIPKLSAKVICRWLSSEYGVKIIPSSIILK